MQKRYRRLFWTQWAIWLAFLFGLAGAARVEGVVHVNTPAAALLEVARCALAAAARPAA